MQPDIDRLLREARNATPRPDRNAEDRAVAALVAAWERTARRRRMPLIGGLALLTVLVGAVAAVASERLVGTRSAEASARVVDRTFVCMPDRSYVTPGGRTLKVGAAPARLVLPHDPFTVPATITVGGAPAGPTSRFVFVRARQFPPDRWQRGFGPGAPGVYANLRRCSTARARVPLSSSGLRGPAVQWDKFVACEVRGRVLVRVRATLAAAGSWGRINDTYSGVQRNVTDAAVTIRVERTRKPVAFARMRGSATALWLSSGCS